MRFNKDLPRRQYEQYGKRQTTQLKPLENCSKRQRLLSWEHIAWLQHIDHRLELKTLYYKLPLIRDLFPGGLITLTQAMDVMASDCVDIIAQVLSDSGIQALIAPVGQDIGIQHAFLNPAFQPLVQVGAINVSLLGKMLGDLSKRARIETVRCLTMLDGQPYRNSI